MGLFALRLLNLREICKKMGTKLYLTVLNSDNDSYKIEASLDLHSLMLFCSYPIKL